MAVKDAFEVLVVLKAPDLTKQFIVHSGSSSRALG